MNNSNLELASKAGFGTDVENYEKAVALAIVIETYLEKKYDNSPAEEEITAGVVEGNLAEAVKNGFTPQDAAVYGELLLRYEYPLKKLFSEAVQISTKVDEIYD
ncbi:hypothetical protein AAEX28_04440 [Lentisphaerota bacterium WC36G]|nr:hypothetical protein LJT99_07305 [Lentisphaerae bacterium WC36]